MKKTLLKTIAIAGLVLLTSCSSIIEQFPPFNETLTPVQNSSTNTVEPLPQKDSPTFTPVPSTPTSTFTPPSVFTDTPGTPTEDIVATLAALQATLDAAADHIATLEAEKTSSASSGSSSGSGSSSSSSSKTSTPEFPSNVRKVTVINRANLRISKRNNDVGKPVMSMPNPRIILDEGAIQFIYNKRVDADGDGVFYEIYDPDGVVTQVLYIRAVDIQIRTSQFNTNFGPIPEGVVIAKANPSAVMRYVKEYNVGGRPLMKIKEPRVVLVDNAQTWIYPDPILSDGGNLFYEIYDPDGIVTTVLYARVVDMLIPNALQQ